MTTFAEFRLLDPDLQTVHGILPFQKGDLYLQLNEPGSGSVKTALDIASAALVESAGFIEAHYRDAVRGGFFVENLGESDVNSGEEAGRGLEISGRGALALLEDAVVWTDGSGVNKRIYSGTQAAMLIELMEEAQTRGGLTIVDWDFTDTLDSDGVAWTDDFPLELTVGTSLLDVVRQIAKTGIDFEMTPDGSGNYVLSAYKDGIGSDKSETVYFRVGVNCTEVSHSEAGGGIRNALLVKYKNGYTFVKDNASIAARRRRESALNYDSVQRSDSAMTFANAELQGKKDPKRQISVKIYDGAGPRAFVDYILGDTITLDTRGTEEEYRIRGIHLSWVDNEHAEVIVDLNSMILENEIRVTQDLDWLLNEWKTAHDAGLLEVKSWTALGKPDDTVTAVYAILIDGDTAYIGTPYSAVIGGVLASSGLVTYNFDTGKWANINTGSTFDVYAICKIGSDIYFGGNSSDIWKWNGSTGSLIGSGDAFSIVHALATDGTDLYAGGTFTDMDAASGCNGLAYYDVSSATWSDLGFSPSALVYALLWYGGDLYATGTTGLKKYSGSWTDLGLTGTGYALANLGTSVIVGGDFTDYLKEWDGATLSTLSGGADGIVRAITVYLADLYISGEMTGKVLRLSGDSWFELEEGLNNTGRALAIHDSTLIAGGSFTVAGTVNAKAIAAYFTSFDELVEHLDTSGEFDLGNAIHSATAKTVMAANDEFGIWDSITQLLRKITWSNILLSIKTYTDTLYVALSGSQTIAGVKTFSSDPIIPDEAYDATAWNGSLEPPTKNAVRDKIESMSGGGGTPAGSDTQVQFNDGGAFGADAAFVFDKTNDSLQIGGTPPGSAASAVTQVAEGVSAGHVLFTWGSGFASYIRGFFARGTVASPTAAQANDPELRIRGAAHDGASYPNSNAEILFLSNENQDATHHGSRVEIYTTPDASITLTKAFTVQGDGNVNIEAGKDYLINGVSSRPAAEVLTDNLFRCSPGGVESKWAGTISSKSGANIVVATTSGNLACLVAVSTGVYAKVRLFNTTRGDYALVSQTVVGTNTITLTATVPAGWAVSDALTTVSTTVNSGDGRNWMECEITSGVTKDHIFLEANHNASAAGTQLGVTPVETFAFSKAFFLTQHVATYASIICEPMAVNGAFALAWQANTTSVIMKYKGYLQ